MFTGGESSSNTFNTQRAELYRRGAGSVPAVCTTRPASRRACHRPQERPHAMVLDAVNNYNEISTSTYLLIKCAKFPLVGVYGVHKVDSKPNCLKCYYKTLWELIQCATETKGSVERPPEQIATSASSSSIVWAHQ